MFPSSRLNNPWLLWFFMSLFGSGAALLGLNLGKYVNADSLILAGIGIGIGVLAFTLFVLTLTDSLRDDASCWLLVLCPTLITPIGNWLLGLVMGGFVNWAILMIATFVAFGLGTWLYVKNMTADDKAAVLAGAR